MALHSILTTERLWANGWAQVEKVRANRTKRTAKADTQRRAHEALTRAYEAELERAAVDGDEPTVDYPGPWVEPDGGRFAQAAARKEVELEQAMHRYAGRVRPEVEPRLSAREGELVEEARRALAVLRRCSAELSDLRETVDYLRAKAEVAPVAGPAPTLTALVEQLSGPGGYSLVTGRPGSAQSMPMNLDDVEIG